MLAGKRYQLVVTTPTEQLLFSASEMSIRRQLTAGGRNRQLDRTIFHNFAHRFKTYKYKSTTNKLDYSAFLYPALLKEAIELGQAKNDIVEYTFFLA